MSPVDWQTELTLQISQDGPTYPFVEDEDGNITGYGHQDPADFAAAVNRYDAECTGQDVDDEDLWTADEVAHHWVIVHPEDEERLHPVAGGTEGAFPVTTIWGAR